MSLIILEINMLLIMYKIPVNEQYVFTINSSTDAASYNIINELSKAINNRLTVGGILRDLKKAFACVNRGTVVDKVDFYRTT
jgi:imidazole glycerol phosphate synthase subunit HisF